MNPQLYGIEHILYLIIFLSISITALILGKIYCKTEKSQTIFLKCAGALLLALIITNRVSIVFKTPTPEWKWLIPDSFCGMSSLVLSLAVLIGKKDNDVLHFVWLIALGGGLITTFYPNFIGQNPSFLYLPTISGMLHHGISAMLVISLFLFNHITLSYKKWYCTVIGFSFLISFGCFLIYVLGFHDAYSIVTPVMSNTPFTIWGIAPIYITVYILIITITEIVRKVKSRKLAKQEN